MLEVILYIWLGIAAVIGYGAALFFAFFALDDPSIPGYLTYVVYFVAWFIIGTVLTVLAALGIGFSPLLSAAIFIFKEFFKRR
jgi:hypothetical protein